MAVSVLPAAISSPSSSRRTGCWVRRRMVRPVKRSMWRPSWIRLITRLRASRGQWVIRRGARTTRSIRSSSGLASGQQRDVGLERADVADHDRAGPPAHRRAVVDGDLDGDERVVEVLDGRDDVRRPADALLQVVRGVGDDRGVQAEPGHHHEPVGAEFVAFDLNAVDPAARSRPAPRTARSPGRARSRGCGRAGCRYRPAAPRPGSSVRRVRRRPPGPYRLPRRPRPGRPSPRSRAGPSRRRRRPRSSRARGSR